LQVPFISQEKRKESLEKARLFKIQRAKIKQSIKKGIVNFNEIFGENKNYKDIVSNMKLIDLIKSLPGIGEIKAKRILNGLKISERKTVKGLGEKQKEVFKKYFKIGEYIT
jgi:DNA uptake protein ComE-like DNA-binding protein